MQAPACAQIGTLVLCIARSVVCIYHQPPRVITDAASAQASMATQPPVTLSVPGGNLPIFHPVQDFTHIRLLSGDLDAIETFAMHENSGWLISIAQDICDPRGRSGTLHRLDQQQPVVWTPVDPADPLVATTYEYIPPDGSNVRLTKISLRNGKSKTTALGYGSTMRARVLARDDSRCWVTLLKDPKHLINSHIVPKRMGDHLSRLILDEFCSMDNSTLGVYNTEFGITLYGFLDTFFDQYELGFRLAASGSYNAHLFLLDAKATTTIHSPFPGSAPLLHGYNVPIPCPTHPNCPPPGLFRWHYLQCVLKLFAHQDYRDEPNVRFAELEMRMDGDSDDEDWTDPGPGDWPSAAWDLGRAGFKQLQEEAERRESVACWVASQS